MKLKDYIDIEITPNRKRSEYLIKKQNILKSLNLDDDVLNMETMQTILYMKLDTVDDVLKSIIKIKNQYDNQQNRRKKKPTKPIIEDSRLTNIYNELQKFKAIFLEWSSVNGFEYNSLTSLIKKYIQSMEFNIKQSKTIKQKL